MLQKARNAVKIYRERGLYGLYLTYRKHIPQSAKSRWRAGVDSEISFWDEYFRTKGFDRSDNYKFRLNPDLPLQRRLVALLPPQTKVQILDVGAGPLTYLGKRCEGKQIDITAIDPLADEYNDILDKYMVHPLVKTQKLAAEDIAASFSPNTFDLVFARNCIDHAYDPEKAILQMIKAVKSGRYVLLEHIPNEAENEKYAGLHQWNFSKSPEGDFIIGSRFRKVNMTKKYLGRCSIMCELVTENEGENRGDWLITRILKK